MIIGLVTLGLIHLAFVGKVVHEAMKKISSLHLDDNCESDFPRNDENSRKNDEDENDYPNYFE